MRLPKNSEDSMLKWKSDETDQFLSKMWVNIILKLIQVVAFSETLTCLTAICVASFDLLRCVRILHTRPAWCRNTDMCQPVTDSHWQRFTLPNLVVVLQSVSSLLPLLFGRKRGELELLVSIQRCFRFMLLCPSRSTGWHGFSLEFNKYLLQLQSFKNK